MNEKANINVEAGCPVLIEISGVVEKLKSKVVGLEHGIYLILRTPAGSAEVLNAMSPGKTVVVKYVYQGVAYGFQTHVLSLISSPSNLIFLSYPQVVAEQSLRAETRYNCYFSCKIHAEDIVMPGTMVDISMKGSCCMIPVQDQHTDGGFSLGKAVQLEIEKPDSEDTFKLSGTIKNIAESDRMSRAGITFNDINDEQKEELKQLIFPLFVI